MDVFIVPQYVVGLPSLTHYILYLDKVVIVVYNFNIGEQDRALQECNSSGSPARKNGFHFG